MVLFQINEFFIGYRCGSGQVAGFEREKRRNLDCPDRGRDCDAALPEPGPRERVHKPAGRLHGIDAGGIFNIKNPSGVDSVESARGLMDALARSWLRERGIAVPASVRTIEISPLLALEPGDLPASTSVPDKELVYLE